MVHRKFRHFTNRFDRNASEVANYDAWWKPLPLMDKLGPGFIEAIQCSPKLILPNFFPFLNRLFAAMKRLSAQAVWPETYKVAAVCRAKLARCLLEGE